MVDTYKRTHKSSRFTNWLYQTSLILLIVLISIVLLATGYDIVKQVVLPSRGVVRWGDTGSTIGGYALVLLASAIITLSRLWTVRRVLASIPKAFIPLARDDLGKVSSYHCGAGNTSLASGSLPHPDNHRTCIA